MKEFKEIEENSIKVTLGGDHYRATPTLLEIFFDGDITTTLQPKKLNYSKKLSLYIRRLYKIVLNYSKKP